MAKAAKKSTTGKEDPDAALRAMIKRHDQLWARWGRLIKQNEDDARIPELSSACCELEPIIVTAPALTRAGLAAKRRVIDKVGYAAVNGKPDLATGDVAELVAAILAVDAERVAAAG